MGLHGSLAAPLLLILCACQHVDSVPPEADVDTPHTVTTPVEDEVMPPNIVVIVADDLGYGDLSTYSADGVPTPNLDRLAEQGVRLTSAYVTAPTCGPSRAGLLTGRHQQRFGFEFNASPSDPEHDQHGLPVGESTLGDVMQAAGYHTSLIGKWHQGSGAEFYPTDRGFDEFYGFLAGSTAYIDPNLPGVFTAEIPLVETVDGDFVHLGEANRAGDSQLLRGPERQIIDDNETYLTEALTTEAVDYIERKADSPFFLYLSYTAPHAPLQVTQEYWDRFPDIDDTTERIYAGMISAMDDGIGEVLDALDRLDLAENTLVVFVSDNGCATYTEVCSCEPVRGGKGSHLEGGIRVPFVMRWPARVPSGQIYDEMASSLDILPTMAAAVGAELPEDRVFDGVDLLPFLRDEVEGVPHDALFWRSGSQAAVRVGEEKLWAFQNVGQSRLYDLAADQLELDDLSAQAPDAVQRLDEELLAWESSLAEPGWQTWTELLSDQCGEIQVIRP